MPSNSPSNSPRNSPRPWYFVTLHVFTVILSVLVLFLALENRRLKEPGSDQVETLARGEQLPPVHVRELDGAAAELRFGESGRKTVALLFTTTCHVCQDNLGHWRKLYERLGDSHDFVAIGLDEEEAVRAYARERALPYRVVTPRDRGAFARAFRVRAVPQTIFVDAAGRVAEVTLGRL